MVHYLKYGTQWPTVLNWYSSPSPLPSPLPPAMLTTHNLPRFRVSTLQDTAAAAPPAAAKGRGGRGGGKRKVAAAEPAPKKVAKKEEKKEGSNHVC